MASPDSNLGSFVPKLLSIVEKAGDSQQQTFQSRVTLAWIYLSINNAESAASSLPENFATTVEGFSHDRKALSSLTEVCLVKGCYIKGMVEECAPISS